MSESYSRLLVYIDGESHFIRSEKAWCRLHSECSSLDTIATRRKSDPPILLDSPCKVFWSKAFSPGAFRLVYFSAFSGDGNSLHDVRKRLCSFGLEPNIYHEPSQLKKQRENLLNTSGVIEKAKQVDIGLTVRALQDSLMEGLRECHIYTSDVDFVPLVQALKGRGPIVKVFGYSNGLGNQSELETVPDQFVDLTKELESRFLVRKS